MTRYVGNNGLAKIGNDTIAQVVGFDCTVTSNAVDVSDLASDDINASGSLAVTGTITVRRDITATAQGNLTAGSLVALTLAPTGTSGNETLEFTARIGSEVTGAARNSPVDKTVNFDLGADDFARGTL